MRTSAQKTELQKATSQKATSQKTTSQKTELQKATSQKATSQKTEPQKTTSQKTSAQRAQMLRTLTVMREAIATGLDKNLRSHSGMSGGNAYRMKSLIDSGRIEDNVFNRTVVYALATAETNACMGRIVAAPTAGASGVLPAVLIAAAEIYGVDDEKVVDALFLTGEIGMRIAKEASLSGAECGCQAECGSAAAMAAAGMVFLMDGTPEQQENAAALALKSLLGLVCDPVAGLVEVPCVKRNAICTSVAITSANMSLAGIESVIPFDEVAVAMKQIGRSMPSELKETAQGGCAATKTGVSIAQNLSTDDTLDA